MKPRVDNFRDVLQRRTRVLWCKQGVWHVEVWRDDIGGYRLYCQLLIGVDGNGCGVAYDAIRKYRTLYGARQATKRFR